jgi:hypothetical protein
MLSDRLMKRVQLVEELAADHYWRASIFGKAIVEREIGHALEKRQFRYRVKIPGGWQSEFTSELTLKRLGRRINSVNLPPGAEISVL